MIEHQCKIDFIGEDSPCGFCRKGKSEECVCNDEWHRMRDYITSLKENHLAESDKICYICGNLPAECFCQAYSERFYMYVKETLTVVAQKDKADHLSSFCIDTSCWG
ncbi:unnamed protein product [Clavelina lepadiformis]|uniref:Uncharacterized protein n=1 Tax=Clavelina lepadiformis TaxID=159417 RepID=A0ABP0G004_CLALP